MSEPAVATPHRVWRAGGFALTSAVLASLAHAVAGGALPNLWLLGLGALVVGAVALPFVRREASWITIALALALAQSGLHGWLTITAHHHGHTSVPAMLATHAVATALAVAWLSLLEERLWNASRRSWIVLVLSRRAWLPVPAVADGRPVQPPQATPRFGYDGFRPRGIGLRGPPVVAVH